MYGGDGKFAIVQKVFGFLDSMLIPFVAVEVLSEKIERVKSIVLAYLGI